MVIPTQRSGADEVAQNYFININPCRNVAMYSLMVYFIYSLLRGVATCDCYYFSFFRFDIKHSNEIGPISKIVMRDT